VGEFEKTLALDSENVDAHSNLKELHRLLGDEEKALYHQELHERYKPDENISRARELARKQYPAASRASEPVVIYELDRDLKPEAAEPKVSDAGN
jgi:hypothetical protein